MKHLNCRFITRKVRELATFVEHVVHQTVIASRQRDDLSDGPSDLLVVLQETRQ